MTTPLGNGLMSLLRKNKHFIAALWKLERSDGVIMRFTDHSHKIIYLGDEYTPTDGVSSSARRKQTGFSGQDVEILGIVSDSSITYDDLRAGLMDGTKIIETLIDYRFPYLGFLNQYKYTIINLTFSGEVWEAKVEGISRELNQRVGRIYGRNCDNDLGDSICRVDVVALSENGTVFAINFVGPTARAVFDVTGLTEAAGFFDHGRLTWITGLNAGIKSQVKFHTIPGATTIELQKPTPFDITVNDQFNVEPGCAKRLLEDCRDKFNNVDNYGGFPFIPGTDATLTIPGF